MKIKLEIVKVGDKSNEKLQEVPLTKHANLGNKLHKIKFTKRYEF